MNRRFFRDLFSSRLLLPVFAVLVLAGALQLVVSQWLIDSQVGALSSSVEASLEAGRQRVSADFDRANADVEQRLAAMGEQTATELTSQLKNQLDERQRQIAANVKKRVINEAQGLADVLASVAAPLIWDRDVPKLTDLIELADARESVLFAAYYDQYGKRLTRYVDRTDPRVKALMEKGEGHGAVGRVLDAASRDDNVVIISADIAPQGSVIGQLKLGLSTQALTDDMSQLEQQFGDTIANSAKAVSTTLAQQTGEVSQHLQSQLGTIEGKTQEEIQATVDSIDRQAGDLSDRLSLFSILSSLALIILTAVVLGAVVLVKIRRLNDAIWAIADGDADLRQRVALGGRNELTHMAAGVNRFIGRIQDMVGQVNRSANTAADQAREQSAASRDAVAEVNSQRGEIEQVSSTVNAMSDSIQEVAGTIQEVARSVQSVNTESEATAELSRQARGQLDLMVADVEEAVTVVTELNSQSGEIGSVLSVIGSIAEQTNLLALNAAIEAARAGESGRGFAVVADEVRTLASRTQSSTTEIQGIIDRLQSGSGKALKTIQQASSCVAESSNQIRAADEHFEQISQLLGQLQDRAIAISAAAEQQSAQALEISQNVREVAQSAESTVAAIQRSDRASHAIESVVRELQQAAEQFRV
ncbi:MAG: HAMP domain-containing methyl-accepting chemotaxis protein [Marinobacter sp.]|nr:HAMP domain-containing methyl-accepting chemotaxis protein [Marinobacter sp.]